MDKSRYQGKKVAIAGFAVEGRSNLEYFSNLGAEVEIFDSKPEIESLPEGVKTHLNFNFDNEITGFDYLVRTAGLAPTRIHTDAEVISATIEFFNKCQATIIGVTGTKGKGTTSTLIHEILKKAGINCHLVGNIGLSALEALPNIKSDDVVVYELSSFQLWDLEVSPPIAVVLMIEKDHMDIHASMEEYIEAKSNIVAHQKPNDVVFYHPNNKYSEQIAEQSPGKQIKYMTNESCNVEDGKVVIAGQEIVSVDEVGLLGEHNLENICAAVSASFQITQDVASISSVVKSFKGLEHRIEVVAEINGITYVNDSYSSAPGASIAAIKSFEGPKVVILGGYNKNLDYSELATFVSSTPDLKALLIGQTANDMKEALDSQGFNNYVLSEAKTMDNILSDARQLLDGEGTLILSPGTSSFDMFDNFKDRGNKFKEEVNKLKT